MQELAAACLGNLVLGRRDLLEQATSLTGRGRDMVPNLSSSVTGVVRESSRALVNLWAPGVTAHGLTGGGFGGTGAWGGSGGSDVANGSGDGRYGGAGVIDIAQVRVVGLFTSLLRAPSPVLSPCLPSLLPFPFSPSLLPLPPLSPSPPLRSLAHARLPHPFTQTRAIALSAVLKAADMASVPPVIPLSRMAGHIRPGQWVVQEFSSRGEPFQTLLVSMSEADRSTKGASDVETGVVRLQGILAGIRRTFEAPTVAAPDVEGISGDDIETGAASRLGAAVSRREDEGFSPPGREAPVEGWWVPESGEIVVLFAGFDGDYGRPGRPLGALGLFGTRDEVGAWGIACKCTVGDKAPPIGGSRRVFRMYPINGLV